MIAAYKSTAEAADGNIDVRRTEALLPAGALQSASTRARSSNPTSTAHIPVVALSANAMPRDIEKGLAAGFFRYLTKPIKVKEFMDTLNAATEFAEKNGRSGHLTQDQCNDQFIGHSEGQHPRS